MDQNTSADADQLPSSWQGDSTPPSNNYSLGARVLRVGASQNTLSYFNHDALLFCGDETKDRIGLAVKDDNTPEIEPSTDLSPAKPNPFHPHTTCRESTQSGSVRSFFVQVSLP